MNGRNLLLRSRFTESIGLVAAFGVIGNANVFPTHLFCFLHHLFECAVPIGSCCMVVECATDVLNFDEMGECSLFGSGPPSRVLPQLWWNEGKAKNFIDI